MYVLFLPEVFKIHKKGFDCYFIDRVCVSKILLFLKGWGKLQLSLTKILYGKVARSNDEICTCPSSIFLKCYFVLFKFL